MSKKESLESYLCLIFSLTWYYDHVVRKHPWLPGTIIIIISSSETVPVDLKESMSLNPEGKTDESGDKAEASENDPNEDLANKLNDHANIS